MNKSNYPEKKSLSAIMVMWAIIILTIAVCKSYGQTTYVSLDTLQSGDTLNYCTAGYSEVILYKPAAALTNINWEVQNPTWHLVYSDSLVLYPENSGPIWFHSDQTSLFVIYIKNGAPANNLSIWQSPPDSVLCIGDAVYFYPIPYNAGPPINSTYEWYLNGTLFSTDPAIGILFNSTGFYNVTVQETNYGCQGPIVYNNMTLDVIGPPNVSISGTAQFCLSGDTVHYQVPLLPNVHYEWTSSGGTIIDTSNNELDICFNTPGTFTINILGINSCNQVTGHKNVTVYSLTANAGIDKTIICGGSAQLDSVTSNYAGTDTLTYSWLPTIGLDSSNIANPIVTIDSSLTYTVTITTLDGCVATDDVIVTMTPLNSPEICIVGVDTNNKNRVIWEKPFSTVIDSFYIFRETSLYNVFAKIGGTAYSDFTVFIDTASHPDVQSNKYKISIIDNCGLETAKSDPHKTMHLTINHGMGTTWNLIWEAYEGFAVLTYNIYRGTTPDSLTLIGSIAGGGATQYTDNTAPAGYLYYQIEVVRPIPCNPSKSITSSLSNIASTQYAGIENNSDVSGNFSINPNPAHDKIEISMSQNSQIEVLSIDGQCIKIINNAINKTIIDMSNLSSGVYIIKAKSDSGIVTKKIIKQ